MEKPAGGSPKGHVGVASSTSCRLHSGRWQEAVGRRGTLVNAAHLWSYCRCRGWRGTIRMSSSSHGLATSRSEWSMVRRTSVA
jgi:hypothetical protein